MPSWAFDRFLTYVKPEIEVMIEIFRERNAGRGPNQNYALLHGALVLLVSGWEVYCEDVAK